MKNKMYVKYKKSKIVTIWEMSEDLREERLIYCSPPTNAIKDWKLYYDEDDQEEWKDLLHQDNEFDIKVITENDVFLEQI